MQRTTCLLVICSDDMRPGEIASFLGIPLKDHCTKNAVTGSEWPKTHPYNIATFSPALSATVTMDEHVMALLDMINPINDKLSRLGKSCVVTINCVCSFQKEGGWTFDASLLQRLAATRLNVVVSLSAE